MMENIKIPFATKTFVERDPPRKRLHVITTLPEHPSSPRFKAGMKMDMLEAIAVAVAKHGLDGYKIHWSD